jgi:AcrR family transcriptional regulator
MIRREKIPATATDRRDTYHHGDLKRALTEAALELVTEKGPKGFTLREVARRAGVSAAAPYRHFSDKAQLLGAVATQGFIQLHETLSAATDEKADLTRQVLDMGRAYVRWAVTHPDYYQVMFGSELDKSDNPELLTAGARAFDDLLARHVGHAQRRPPDGPVSLPDAVAMLDTAYLGHVIVLWSWALTQPETEGADVATGSTTVRFRSLDGRDREIAVPRLAFTEPITTLAGAST